MKKRSFPVFVLIAAICLAILCAACAKTPASKPDDPAGSSETAPVSTEAPGDPATADAEPDTSAPETETVPEDETESEPQPAASAPAEAKPAVITVDFAGKEDLPGALDFAASEDEPLSRVVFTTDAEVRDFRFLSLSDPQADGEDGFSFATRELWKPETFSPEHPLRVTLTFYGDLPSYGIMYTDETGAIRTFALEMSGEDGHLYLAEF